MGRFVNKATGVTFMVADDKDDRYADERFESADEKKASAKKAASGKSEK